MGLVTVDQAPVAVVVTGLASVAQGPAEPLAVPAGPHSEPVPETIDLEDIVGEQVPVKVDHLGTDRHAPVVVFISESIQNCKRFDITLQYSKYSLIVYVIPLAGLYSVLLPLISATQLSLKKFPDCVNLGSGLPRSLSFCNSKVQ